MATLNLGRIKPVFRGAYAGGTAYVIDDIVTSGGETFICIQATTGNATSSASHWTKLAEKGTNGSNGTDLTSTLTTRGDIVYKGASALTRLPKGTAGYVLKQGANDPEWGTAPSGDYVKIAQADFSNVGAVVLDGTSVWGTWGTYKLHKLVFDNFRCTESTNLRIQNMNSGSVHSSGDYSWNVIQSNSSSTGLGVANGDSSSYIEITRDQIRGDNDSTNYINFEITLGHVNAGSQSKTLMVTSHISSPNQDNSNRNIGHLAFGSTRANDGTANASRTGIRLYPALGNIYGTYTVYGFKA